MSYLIYKKKSIKAMMPFLEMYNGQPVISGATPTLIDSDTATSQELYSLPITSLQNYNSCSFNIETYNNTEQATSTITNVWLQFGLNGTYPEKVYVNGEQFTNTGYICHCELETPITKGTNTIQLVFSNYHDNTKNVILNNINEYEIGIIPREKINSIVCNEESDRTTLTLPIGYANLNLKDDAANLLDENDEIDVLYDDTHIIDRYYIKKKEFLRDGTYSLYCEDIIGVLDTIDGGTVTLQTGSSYPTHILKNSDLNTQILKGYCYGRSSAYGHGLFGHYSAYEMTETWSGKTIRENIQQFILAQCSKMTRQVIMPFDIFMLDSDQDLPTGETLPSSDIYNDLQINHIETLKKLTVVYNETAGLVYVANSTNPNSQGIKTIAEGIIKCNGQNYDGNRPLARWITGAIGTGKQAEFKAIITDLSQLDYIRAGRMLSIQTSQTTSYTGFISSITFTIANTIVAQIVLDNVS